MTYINPIRFATRLIPVEKPYIGFKTLGPNNEEAQVVGFSRGQMDRLPEPGDWFTVGWMPFQAYVCDRVREIMDFAGAKMWLAHAVKVVNKREAA